MANTLSRRTFVSAGAALPAAAQTAGMTRVLPGTQPLDDSGDLGMKMLTGIDT